MLLFSVGPVLLLILAGGDEVTGFQSLSRSTGLQRQELTKQQRRLWFGTDTASRGPSTLRDVAANTASWTPSSAALRRSVTEPIRDDVVSSANEAPVEPVLDADRKTVLILNLNARGVTEQTAAVAREIFGEASVYVTTTAEEADAAASAIASNPSITTLIPMGGDGTLTAVLQSMCRAVQSQHPELTLAETIKMLPVIAYVPLGTGNAVGSVVGCRVTGWRRRGAKLKALLKQLKEVVKSDQEVSIVELPILEVTTKTSQQGSTVTTSDLCFFAGVGFDSLMLNDFKDIKAWSKKTGILTSLLSSVTGYCVALVVKTLPKTISKSSHKVHVKVTTHDPGTLWVDHRRGDFCQKCRNTTLFEGETGILAAGTAPYYGGGLKLFPFARMTVDKMHLRLGRIHPATGFFHIPAIFAGSYRDTSDSFGVLDFIGADFEVQVSSAQQNADGKDTGFPFQHSGESVGNVESFRLRVVDEPVRFLSLLNER